MLNNTFVTNLELPNYFKHVLLIIVKKLLKITETLIIYVIKIKLKIYWNLLQASKYN